MNSAALRAAALAAAIGVAGKKRKPILARRAVAMAAAIGAGGSKKTKRKPTLFNHDTNGDGITHLTSKVKVLPAESAEQLIPPGTKITKAALRKAAAQFSVQKAKKGEVAGLNFRSKGTAT